LSIDHDWHVSAADRDDHQHSQRQRDDRDQPEVERAAVEHEADDEEHQRHAKRDVDKMARGQNNRLAAHARRQF
jgi:hypothetical protein